MLIGNKEIILDRKKIAVISIILVIIAGIVYFGVVCFLQARQIQTLQKQLKTQQTNVKIVSFLNLFIEKVLNAQGEVSFEDRLKLENAVRDLNDNQLLTLWENFTQATTNDQIQQAAKDLLQSLVSKILY